MVATLEKIHQIESFPVMAEIPVLTVEINPIASNNNLQPDWVANQIAAAGGIVARVGEMFLTSRDAWNNFVNVHTANIRRALLLDEVDASSDVQTAPPPPPATTKKPGRPPKSAEDAEPTFTRLKLGWKTTTNYSRTLASFLDTQGWEPGKRADVIEQIAALPAEPSGSKSLAEISVQRIVRSYPVAKRKDHGARGGIIAAAKAMIGEANVPF